MTDSYAAQRRKERAADKAELTQIRAGHDRCLCGHEHRQHAACPLDGCDIEHCDRPACGCNAFRPDPRYAR